MKLRKSSEPSAIALLIAKATVFLLHDRRLSRLVPEAAGVWCERFVREASPSGEAFMRRLRSAWYRRWLWTIEWLTLPGILIHYQIRKRQIEILVRRAIEDGFTHVVVLGAGFDTLSLRLHREFPQVTWIETDHPNTSEVKERISTRHSLGSNLEFRHCDLNAVGEFEGLLELLRLENQSALFVAEAVLMYLGGERVHEVFQGLKGLPCSNLRFLFTFMERQRDGRINFARISRLISWWMQRHGEPFRWGVSAARVNTFLGRHSFEASRVISERESGDTILGPLGLRGLRLLEGEYVCVADRRWASAPVPAGVPDSVSSPGGWEEVS